MANKKITKSKPNKPSIPKQVTFDYIKSNDYREFYANGVFGGISPGGKIMMSMFFERSPIPTKIFHNVLKDGKLGEEIRSKRESRDSIIRSVQATILMDPDGALALRNWIDDKLKTLETPVVPAVRTKKAPVRKVKRIKK